MFARLGAGGVGGGGGGCWGGGGLRGTRGGLDGRRRESLHWMVCIHVCMYLQKTAEGIYRRPLKGLRCMMGLFTCNHPGSGSPANFSPETTLPKESLAPGSFPQSGNNWHLGHFHSLATTGTWKGTRSFVEMTQVPVVASLALSRVVSGEILAGVSDPGWWWWWWWRDPDRQLWLTLYCRHQNDFCIQMGSDDSHCNASIIRCEDWAKS